MKKWLFNPFIYVAGWQALGFGLLVMLVTAVIASFSHTDFDGSVDVHFGPELPFWFYIFEQLNAWLSSIIIFFLAGLILSKSKIRFIDVAGTIALARAPMLFAAILGFVPVLHQLPATNHLPAMAFWGLIVAIFSIWMIVLIYRAFIISCNLKGSRAVIGFIASLIISEIVSKVLLTQVYHHFVSKS